MSIIAAALRELIAAGVTGDALVTAIERIEAAKSASMSQAAKRQALYRERQKALRHNVTSQASRDVTTSQNSDDLSLIKKDKKERKRERGSRIARDWVPTDGDREFGLAQGLANSEIEREAAKFVDYWNAKAGAAGVKLDWSATWRNWLRRTGEQRAGNGAKALTNITIGETINGYEWTGSRWKEIEP